MTFPRCHLNLSSKNVIYFTFGGTTVAMREPMDKFGQGRLLICAIALFAVSGVSAAQGGAKLPRVAILEPGPRNSPAVCPAGFRQGLRDLGYVEGKNITLEFRYANGQPEQLQPLAAELVRLNPAVIWTHGVHIDRTKHATSKIPIVFGVSADVVERGIVASLARPGGNITGIELRLSELADKRLEILKAVVPAAVRVAFLVTGFESTPHAAAKAFGLQVLRFQANHESEFEAAFASMKQGRVNALVISDGPIFGTNRQRLLDLAIMHGLPTMSGGPHYADAGSLLAYGPDVREACGRSAGLVDKILKGADPATLPVERVYRFQLIVNLRTAKKLGLSIPKSVLVRADRVIE